MAPDPSIWHRRHALDKRRREAVREAMAAFDVEHHKAMAAPREEAAAPAPARTVAPPRPAPRQATGAAPSTGFDDLDDDIPFVSCAPTHDMASLQSRKLRRYKHGF